MAERNLNHLTGRDRRQKGHDEGDHLPGGEPEF
jgi:hypothetical protein